MKNRVLAGTIVTLLLLCLVQITLNFASSVSGEPDAGRKEVWQLVTVNNTLPYNTVMDLNVTVNSRTGVNIACSNNVTLYSQNLTYWQGLGYMTYFDWLNGTSTLVHHWGDMDWYVSNGSLTPISYSDIQFWGDMYLDSGGGVNYTTFMGNTFMADWNLSSPNNNPDIVSQANWQGNQIKMIASLMVPSDPMTPGNTTISIVFDIVMTQAGSYTFNITTTPGVTVTPSSWTVGGASTILVPDDKPTIHEALSAANLGDTIAVAPGTYHESQVLIDKPVRLIGSGAGTTIIDGQLVAPPTVGLVRITANTGQVTFSGFTVRNAGKTSGTRVAIYASSTSPGVNYTISNNAIYGTNDPNDDQDYGFYTYQGNESLVFTNNSITQTGANPILIEQHLGAVEISYNVLDVGVWGSDAIFCMTYGGRNITSLQRIRNNTINMGTGGNPFDYDHRATGITFASSYNSAVLGNGTFTNIQITGNNIFNLASYRRGIGFWNGATGDGTGGNIISAQISGNTINGTGASESYGMRLLGLVSNASIIGNNITNNAYGIYADHATGFSASSNNIFGNSVFGIDNVGLEALSAKYNWWGNETGPHSSASQYPNSPGDNVSDNVVFGPWLTKPYPPAVPISVLYVDPPLVALTAPALNTTVSANVTIGNVTMMYGYQYTLQWDSNLLNLITVTDRIPTVWGTNYFISQKIQKPGNYSFAVAAKAPAPPFNGSTALASFTFKTTYDPIYPDNASCLLALTNVTIGNPAPSPILSLVLSGNYSINSVRSKLLFMSDQYVATHVPKEFDATLNVTSVINLCAFDFTCYFNTTLLNVVYLNVSSSLGGLPVVVQGWDNNVGYFHLNVTGIAPVNGTKVLATVHFKVAQGFVWSTVAPTVNCSLFFMSSTFVNQTGGSIEHEAINGTYIYRPLQGDASMDGLVDIVDLVMVAQGFGLSIGDPQYSLYINADINRDGTIDILDIIYVAHNFGSSTGP
jgi:hypothetical protein